jgi:hypothetical protein
LERIKNLKDRVSIVSTVFLYYFSLKKRIILLGGISEKYCGYYGYYGLKFYTLE